jgi:DNA excision repair protein ERCC-1
MQSFADIAKTPADRLQMLPGFGQVKVKKIKDAFERPFRHNATSTLPSTFEAEKLNSATGNEKSKGKEVARSLPESSTTGDYPRPPREPSPIWDLELDLDVDGNAHISPESRPSPVPRAPDKSANGNNVDGRQGSSSPIWDIDLDLNGSDGIDGKEKGGFGGARLL